MDRLCQVSPRLFSYSLFLTLLYPAQVSQKQEILFFDFILFIPDPSNCIILLFDSWNVVLRIWWAMESNGRNQLNN